MHTALRLGFDLFHQGRSEDARDALRGAVQADPANPLAHHLLGIALFHTNEVEAGLASLRQAAALAPSDPIVHGNLGNALLKLSRFDEAADSFEQALQSNLTDVEALLGHGDALLKAGRADAALEAFDRAVTLAPDMATAWTNRGAALCRLDRPADALRDFARAIALAPRDGRLRFNRGTTLIDLGRYAEALEELGAAMALEPSLPNARLSAAFAHLALGSFQRGWELYEARWGVSHGQAPVADGPPLWRGDTPLQGLTILLRAEQGLGDTLQFCRYAKLLKARGAQVALRVPRPLLTLMATLPGIDSVTCEGEPLPPADLQCFLMSLPLALGVSEPYAEDTPYLSADADKVSSWRSRLRGEGRLRVGLIWTSGKRGMPEVDWVHRRRDVQLDRLRVLRDLEAHFVSLQKGKAAQSELARTQAADWDGPPILDVSQELHDFSDTAALMQALDLVISVDTATAHLAGALGRPVWLLACHASCWRWIGSGERSAWYPSMKIYRQVHPGNWDDVLHRVRVDLQHASRLTVTR